jgi:hypothetical protein
MQYVIFGQLMRGAEFYLLALGLLIVPPVLGIWRAVERGSVGHALASHFVPLYGLIYYYGSGGAAREEVVVTRKQPDTSCPPLLTEPDTPRPPLVSISRSEPARLGGLLPPPRPLQSTSTASWLFAIAAIIVVLIALMATA